MKTLPITETINGNERSAFCAVAIAAAAFCASADTFTYVDHWPSGTGDETATEVVVPDNTPATISTAEDVTRVARLTAISLGTGATVTYNASTALTLSASVSGSGKFSAISSGNLTLSGDNSGLESPGCFFFSNTAVTVASRYGLGSTGSATLHYWFGGKVDPLHFTGAGLTNDAPIRVHQGTAAENFALGPDNANETLVIANDLIFTGGNGTKYVYFRNKVRFTGGKFGSETSGTTHTYSSVWNNGTAEVWFEQNVKLNFFYWHSYGNLTFHLAWAGLTGDRYTFIVGDGTSLPYAEFEKDGVLSFLVRGVSGKGTFNLKGHDQSVKLITKAYGSPTITSDTPATFSVVSWNTGSADYLSSSTKFSGKVNFTYSPSSTTGAYTLTGSSALSDSCGTLTVGGAGHLIFASGAGWSGTNVVVQSGATLELNSAKAMTNTTATLTVETGGHLILRSGAACTAEHVTIAGETLDADTQYTVAQLRDEMGLPVDGDDFATIVVSGGSSEWHGWPTTPGAVADVPAGLTVYVSDEDIATLEALGGIILRSGATVICTNLTERLDLSAPVSGIGSFQALNSTNIVLSGNNSSLVSPGCFFFSNTAVTVASRYGLGSSGTATLHYWFGNKVDPLHFTGAGLTNDAPLRIHQGTAVANFAFGPDNAGETLVVGNDLIFDSCSYSTPARYIYFRNKVRFTGGKFGSKPDDSYTCCSVWNDGTAEVWFEQNVKVNFYYWFSYKNLTYHFAWDGVLGNYYTIALGYNTSLPYAEFEKDGVLDMLKRGVSGNGTFNLKGHDQSVNYITKAYGSPTITSDTPATFSVVKWSSETANYLSSSTKFTGAVNFTYAPTTASGTYTLTGSAALSTSTGKLTVGGAGQLVFANGAGWCGTNVLVKAGAKLSVGAASMPVAFGSRAVLGHSSRTKLEIENGGTLELAASAEPAVVRTLVYNGQIMPAGTYTKTSGVGITGDGVLRVRSSTDGEPGVMFIFR